jgi:hypothetical protein
MVTDARGLVGQVGNLQRVGNPLADAGIRAGQRRLPVGAQDTILPHSRRASQRGSDMRERIAHAVSARYDRKTGRIVIELSSKLVLSFLPADVEGLEDAHPPQLKDVEITPSGFGVHFPALDADLYIPGLLEGFLGSKAWMAARLGQAGGRSKSAAKKSASRVNGRLGGRPRRSAGQRRRRETA